MALREKIIRGETMTHPPFTPCVHNSVTKDQATIPANKISATKFFDDVGVWVSALWADKTNSEVGPERRLLWSFGLRGREGEGLSVSHVSRIGSGDSCAKKQRLGI